MPDLPLLRLLLALAISVAGSLLLVLIINVVLSAAHSRWPRLWRGWIRVRKPFTATLLTVSARAAAPGRLGREDLQDLVGRILEIAVIASVVWLVATLVLYALSLSERRLIGRLSNDRDRRRAQTQLRLIYRLVTVGFVVLGAGLILLTFPGMEQFGAGVLASAGLLSVVAGLAAQSSLANLFAGIQLAFTDAIRIDDVVVVEGEWGRVEDITLTYVVVRIWDERRLILPSTYFTTTPFTNWTRTGHEIVGQVLFHLDWRVDIDRLRGYLDEILADTDLWDRRSSSLLITDATEGIVTVRVVISAADSDDLFFLQCLVREKFVGWLREHNPEALPQQRVEVLSVPPGENPTPAGNPGPQPRTA